MMAVLSAFGDGIGLGLAIAAPFGPINVEIVRRHVSRGIGAGVLLGLGACSVDTVYIVLISIGLIAAAPGPRLQLALAVAGAAILVVLAGLILRAAGSSVRLAVPANADAGCSPPQPLWRNYLVGVLMTATSPMNLVFWFGVIVSGASRGATVWGPWPRVGGVMCGTIAWVAGLNTALAFTRRFLRPRVLAGINLVSATALLALAAWGVWKAAHGG